MTRQLTIMGNDPAGYRALIDKLRAAGFSATARSQRDDLRRSTFSPGSPAAILYDWDSISEDDVAFIQEFGQTHPGLAQIVFCPGLTSDLERQASQGSTAIYLLRRTLADPDAVQLIEKAIPPDPVTVSALGAHQAGSRTRKIPQPGRLDMDRALHSEEFLRRVGSSNVPVLLHGETGVGKEVMARRLWSYSLRASKPFLKLNCAALPSELIESELFGYEKGAFTGATMDKPGKFELAQNGTILLDEIGDMDIRLQAKLLQVLQDGEVQPLGSSRIINVNVRVMAATHRDLRIAIAQGSFREDLYYRLNVVSLTIPALRERRTEIIPLAQQLLQRHLPPGSRAPAITDELRQAMLFYQWPGNVRELENVMRRLLVYQDGDLLAQELLEAGRFAASKNTEVAGRREDQKAGSSGMEAGHVSKVDHLARASRQAESKLLLETLEAVRWNRRQAAERLNVDYKAFLYKLQKYGIKGSRAKSKEASS